MKRHRTRSLRILERGQLPLIERDSCQPALENLCAIHIEERDPGELHALGGARTVAEGIAAWNPVFDVTPHELIDAIVTEKGVIARPDANTMQAAFGG